MRAATLLGALAIGMAPAPDNAAFVRAAAIRAAAATNLVGIPPDRFGFRSFGIVRLPQAARVCGELLEPGADRWRRFVVTIADTSAPQLVYQPGADTRVEPFPDFSDTLAIDTDVACKAAVRAAKTDGSTTQAVAACRTALILNEAGAQRTRFGLAWTLECSAPAARTTPVPAPTFR